MTFGSIRAVDGAEQAVAQAVASARLKQALVALTQAARNGANGTTTARLLSAVYAEIEAVASNAVQAGIELGRQQAESEHSERSQALEGRQRCEQN